MALERQGIYRSLNAFCGQDDCTLKWNVGGGQKKTCYRENWSNSNWTLYEKSNTFQQALKLHYRRSSGLQEGFPQNSTDYPTYFLDADYPTYFKSNLLPCWSLNVSLTKVDETTIEHVVDKLESILACYQPKGLKGQKQPFQTKICSVCSGRSRRAPEGRSEYRQAPRYEGFSERSWRNIHTRPIWSRPRPFSTKTKGSNSLNWCLISSRGCHYI